MHLLHVPSASPPLSAGCCCFRLYPGILTQPSQSPLGSSGVASNAQEVVCEHNSIVSPRIEFFLSKTNRYTAAQLHSAGRCLQERSLSCKLDRWRLCSGDSRRGTFNLCTCSCGASTAWSQLYASRSLSEASLRSTCCILLPPHTRRQPSLQPASAAKLRTTGPAGLP